MDLRPLIGKMKMPWLNVIGEKDELSPIRHTLELAAQCGGPAPIVIYQGERHALSGSSSATVLGPKYEPDRRLAVGPRERPPRRGISGVRHRRGPRRKAAASETQRLTGYSCHPLTAH